MRDPYSHKPETVLSLFLMSARRAMCAQSTAPSSVCVPCIPVDRSTGIATTQGDLDLIVFRMSAMVVVAMATLPSSGHVTNAYRNAGMFFLGDRSVANTTGCEYVRQKDLC